MDLCSWKLRLHENCPIKKTIRDTAMWYHIGGTSDVHWINVGAILRVAGRTGRIAV